MASTARIFGNRCRILMAAASKSSAVAEKSTATSAEVRKNAVRTTGILKVQTVSPALAKFIGSPETSRSGAVKKNLGIRQSSQSSEKKTAHGFGAAHSSRQIWRTNCRLAPNWCNSVKFEVGVGDGFHAKLVRWRRIWRWVGVALSSFRMNPSNRREIFCDDKLKTIFDGKDKVDFTTIAKLLTNHFRKST
ncbi:hypothetical protein F511_18777 [Dorcoceras hygrometricum]|uniref:DM2 domain-containing protein n=1 Tax=Dorcoceras hygrometricum TaxID=472368 RepID=A0A2Z7ADU9_9LAMI|nr:hypothetical protein F511_18777 [Dorcoceras hygrometricum]